MTSSAFSSDLDALFDSISNDLANQGFSVQSHALNDALIDSLRNTLLGLDSQSFKPAAVGRAGQHMTRDQIRRDKIAWIENRAGAQGEWLFFTEQLRHALNRRLMLGLFSFESHFAHYVPGAFYTIHVDSFKGQANRVLSLVLYLNPDWEKDHGGEMVLYSQTTPSVVLCKVRPEAGTLVVFLSEDFPHEVLPAQRDRYSIAGWYRVNASSFNRVDPPA